MKYYSIEIDGIDKTGKDTLWHYIDYVSGRKYVINSRGVISQIAYSELYNRLYEYDLNSQENKLIVFLTADEADWKIRCKITNEPAISYAENMKIFCDVKDRVKNAGLHVVEYNTSHMTPYEIAVDVCSKMDELNGTITEVN